MTGTSRSSLARTLRNASCVTNVFSHPAFGSVILREGAHDWTKSLVGQLDELCKLPSGWDGYCAPPVSFSNASFALTILSQACPLDVPEPQIVPGPNGDLQIEWHTSEADIELHVRGPNDVHAWRLSPTTSPDGEEVEISTNFTIVASWLSELAGAAVADRSAAA